MAELPAVWLQPAENLTTLVLYQDHPFGFFPRLNLRGVRFPRLRTLALGRYTFSHEWQLDWLAEHGATLEELFLDSCTVLFTARVRPGCINAEAYPLWDRATGHHIHNAAAALGALETRFYSLTWARIFARVSNHLPALRRFGFGSSVPAGWDGDAQGDRFRQPEHERLRVQRGLLYRGGVPIYIAFTLDQPPARYLARPVVDADVLAEEAANPAVTRLRDFLRRLDLGEQTEEDVGALVALLTRLGEPIPAALL